MKHLILTLFLVIASIGFGQEPVVIPNVFTPNDDGVNDVFYIRSSGYEKLSCTIYNRYGVIVYQYFGLNGNWDGHTHSAVPCKDGVYFVVVEMTKENGEEYTFQGNLHLIR